jgi:hypothetical protein
MEYSLDYINTVKIFIAIILCYLVYSLSSGTPNTVIYMQQTIIDSSYVTPEGWPSPYPDN